MTRASPLGARAAAALALGCVLAGAGALTAVALRRAPPALPRIGSPPAHALAGDAVWAAGVRRAPAFALRDQFGRRVALADQRGHAVLLTFMDSRCRFVCTLQGPAIARVLRRAGEPVRLLVVSVDPWEDTARSSIAAGARYGFRGDWHWLRGRAAELRPVWRAYGIAVRRARGDVNHSTAIYLIDRRGDERAGFNYPFPPARVARDLRRLTAS